MSDRFTDTIEPRALATQGRVFEGKIPLAELPRLLPLVRSNKGEVEFTLHFDVDVGGAPLIGGNVKTTLMLQCQRCMADMEYTVSSKVRLGIVPTREAAEQLPSNYDPLVVRGEETTIVSILEDELILALPLVAMHEMKDCSQADAGAHEKGLDQRVEQESAAASKKKNPFSVLAQLKQAQPED